MNLENTKDLNLYFSMENLTFLKNINQEITKIDTLLDQNTAKQEKYSLFTSTLTSKNFSNTNKEYFVEVKNITNLLDENQEILKKLKNQLSKIITKVYSLMLVENDKETIKNSVFDITNSLQNYTELVDENVRQIIKNNEMINTFSTYHSTKLLLTTVDQDLGSELNIEITLSTPAQDETKITTTYSDLLGVSESKVLIISEKEQKIYLPYKKTELKAFMSKYPASYKNYKNVIEKEFILPLNKFQQNPNQSRFVQGYSLYRDREACSILESFKNALSLTFKSNLNPAIIAACKTKKQLNNYLTCLSENKTEEFSDFEIIFDMKPI